MAVSSERFWRRRRHPVAGPLAERIYPYLVTDHYPDALSTPTQSQRRIGHGLSVALVSPSGPAGLSVIVPVDAAALADAGIGLSTAYEHAAANLSRALSDQQIPLRFLEQGPAGVPLVVASGHWLAAATLLAPGLRDRMTRLLGDDIVAAVPDRDLLLLFGADAATAMRGEVEEDFDAAAKPLTTGLFTLGDDGPTPLQ